MPTWRLLLTLLLSSHVVLSLRRPAKRHYSTHDYYVLEHDPNAGASLDDVTQFLDVEVVEQVGELKDFWLVRTEKIDGGQGLSERDTTDHIVEKLDNLRSEVAASDWDLTRRSTSDVKARNIVSSVKHISRQVLRQRIKRAPPPPVDPQDSAIDLVAHKFNITDPVFPQQWHIVNEEFPEHTMNVTGVWEMGITGKGVISALIDDGLDYESRDLAANFV